MRGDVSVHVLIDKPAKKAVDPHTFKHSLLFYLFSFYDSNMSFIFDPILKLHLRLFSFKKVPPPPKHLDSL